MIRARVYRHALLTASLAIFGGCQVAAPPRYESTWRWMTSSSYQPAYPYCHGYTPTHWSRWPEECQPPECIIAEELPLPLPPPPTLGPTPIPTPSAVEPAPLPPEPEDIPPVSNEPSIVEPPTPEGLIVPQGYTPLATAEPVQTEAEQTAANERPAPVKKKSWTARLERFVGEVTTFR